jgi:predicted transcriptional regulator
MPRRNNSATPEDTYESFATAEPFKVLAKRYLVSPNTLRSWWVAKFGKEAFDARGKRIQSQAAVAFGASRKGTSHTIGLVTEPCAKCGVVVELNLLQKVRSKQVLCPTCADSERGVDRSCSVCGIGCVGVKGLAMHLAQVEDQAHTKHLQTELNLRWESQVENRDYVSCLLCGHKAVTLARHLLAEHKITAEQYKMQFPGTLIRSESLTASRTKAAKHSHEASPRRGLTKTILCSTCDREFDVSTFFAYSTHDSRCPECKQADLDAADLSKWKGKSEPEDYVTCQVCGHRAESLTSHISSEHQTLVGRYEAIHPNFKLIALSSKLHGPSVLRGRTLSDEVRAKMSGNAGRWNQGLTKNTDVRVASAAEAMKGRTPWNEGLTKEDHSSLQSTSEKLSALKLGVPNDATRLDLSLIDFTPYLDEVGAVDLKIMAEELDICDLTLRKYMSSLGLRSSTKYIEARAERQIIRLEKDDLLPFRLKNGKVVVASAMVGLKKDYKVIKRECLRHDLETFTHGIRQTICLDAISKTLGSATFEQEWKSWRFVNPLSGHRFRFDGYFPSHDLVVEFHGWQHWVFPSVYIKKEELFFALQERDRIKENLIHSDPTLRYFLVREDEPYADLEYLRGRLIDEGILDPGK